MKRLAIIPARSGSKGLLGKNLMTINGETLVARAVRCAKESRCFDEVVVSTDIDGWWLDAKVLARPVALCQDDSNIEDAIKHVLGWYEDFDLLALLQPTSPTRTPEIVRECVGVIIDAEERGVGTFDAAWTVSPVPEKYNDQRQMTICDNYADLQGPGLAVVNRQDLWPTFIKNGQCYAVTANAFRKHGLKGTCCRPIITPGPALTIDTQEDLDEARRILEAEKVKK